MTFTKQSISEEEAVMSDVARKVFPLETVLALFMGKDDVEIRDIAGYLTGRSIACPCAAKLVGPMAAGWLAANYPAFMTLDWAEGVSWEAFVAGVKKEVGDAVSVEPMNARLQATVGAVLDAAATAQDTAAAQAQALADLQAKIDELAPFQAQAKELEAKCAQLEGKIKSLNADMKELRKQAVAFNGKMAVDQEGLEDAIKSAIKENMKGLVVAGGAAAAGAVAADAAAEEAPAEESGSNVPDDFGFGFSGANADGFGF